MVSAFRSPARFALSDRRIVFLMALAGLVQGYGGSLLTTTLPFARNGLGLSAGEMSTILAITRFGSLAALLISYWGDRKGRRVPFLVSFLLLLLANGATAFIPGVGGFTVAQSVARAATVAVASLAVVLLAETLTPAVRAYGISIYAIAGSLGGGTALLILPIADAGEQSWRILFGLTAVGLLILPLLIGALRESPLFGRETSHPLGLRGIGGYGVVFVLLAAMSFLVAAYSSPALSFSLERLVGELEWATGQARLVIIGGGAVGALGLLAGGRMADQWGRRPTTVVSIVFGVLGGVAFYRLENVWLVFVAVVLASFGSSVFVPAYSAHRSELFPTNVRATTGAMLNAASVFGAIAGFWFGSRTIDDMGLFGAMSWLGVGAAAGIVFVLLLPETRGIDLSGPRQDLATGRMPPPAL